MCGLGGRRLRGCRRVLVDEGALGGDEETPHVRAPWPSWGASSSSFWESWRTVVDLDGDVLCRARTWRALTSSSSLITGMGDVAHEDEASAHNRADDALDLEPFLEKSSLIVSGMETCGFTSAMPTR